MQSFRQTAKAFWNSKRTVMLFIFALLIGNLVLYITDQAAKKQVLTNAHSQHYKIYNSYLQSVERTKKELEQSVATTSRESKKSAPGISTPTSASSPYWAAIREIRTQHPGYRMNILITGAVDDETDRAVLDTLKNRPRGWSFTDERDGWSRSYYLLPTKNAAAIQIVSFVKDDLKNWQTTAAYLGGYVFVLFLIFGWFWTRALHSSLEPQQEYKEQVAFKVSEIGSLIEEMTSVIDAIQTALSTEEKPSQGLYSAIAAAEDATNQIRLLAMTGSIEVARSPEQHRVFQLLMQEINQYATRAHETLGQIPYAEKNINHDLVKEKIHLLQTLIKQTTAETTTSNEQATLFAG